MYSIGGKSARHSPFAGDERAVFVDFVNLEISDIVHHDQIRTITWCDRPRDPESVMSCRHQRSVAHRLRRRDTGSHDAPQETVEMTVLQQIRRQDVVGNQSPVVAQLAADQQRQQGIQIVCQRTFSHLHQHSQCGLGAGFFDRFGFVIRVDAGRNVGDQITSGQPRCVAIDWRLAGRAVTSIFASAVVSPARMAGKSIISASPSTRGRLSNSPTSAGPMVAPACSQLVHGTQEEATKKRSNGNPSLASISESMPASPRTLPIS